MKSENFTEIICLPETGGIFNLINKKKESLFIGVAENIKTEILKILKKNIILGRETTQIEIIETAGKDLVKTLARQIRQEKPLYNYTLAGHILYPHIKITNEKFPRLFATRQIEDDAAEYFGAFLPDTKVRFLLGFLIDSFGLRGCDIPIDGCLPQPCPQFYRRKCIAPCVEILCSEDSYNESVNMARFFLVDKIEELENFLFEKINFFSGKLDFETATKWRDLRQAIVAFRQEKNRQFRVENASDSFEIKNSDSKYLINLVTRKSRKILGTRSFVFEKKAGFTQAEILEQILWQFYQFHTPKEISVSDDFPSRKFLSETLSRAADRAVKITVSKASAQKKTVNRAFRRSQFEHEIESSKPARGLDEIQNELKKEFSLLKKPSRIEAFDVAHISGVDFVGAKAVWENGKFKPEEYEFWFVDEKNELAAMKKTLENRFKTKAKLPDAILIDGGQSQLFAAQTALDKSHDLKITVISAVKPPQKHNEISHFLNQEAKKIPFKINSEGFRVLLKLRDEAHELANYIHRTKRETAHFYELFQSTSSVSERERYFLLRQFGSLKNLKIASEEKLIELLGSEKGKSVFRQLKGKYSRAEPFIVSIKYDDPNGEAADLRPLFFTEKIFEK